MYIIQKKNKINLTKSNLDRKLFTKNTKKDNENNRNKKEDNDFRKIIIFQIKVI